MAGAPQSGWAGPVVRVLNREVDFMCAEHLRSVVGQCQAAVAEAVEAFGRIDVLLCAASEGNIIRTLLYHADGCQLLSARLKSWLRAAARSAWWMRSSRSTFSPT
jgi:NAD(P)-dependent dehydrogenase (short-subunit alcohol dehydrogenase family)